MRGGKIDRGFLLSVGTVGNDIPTRCRNSLPDNVLWRMVFP